MDIIRVIAGKAGGLKLKTPKGFSTRPTVDRVKESVFNILNPYIEGSTVLDLFSGTGALGIEALSRGADSAVFVDSDKTCCGIIRENLSHTGFNEKGTVYRRKVYGAIRELGLKQCSFDIIFMDPPYLKNFIQETIHLLVKNDIIKDKGIIVVEHHRDEPISETTGDLRITRTQTYGETNVTFLVHRGL